MENNCVWKHKNTKLRDAVFNFENLEKLEGLDLEIPTVILNSLPRLQTLAIGNC